jgi:hypothetical protein
MKFRLAIAAVAALGLLATGGCGGKGPKMYKVSGVVKYSDDSPLVVPEGGSATITFTPADTTGKLEDGQIRKGAFGQIKEGGKFEMGTVKPGDGVAPNRYKVFLTTKKNRAGNPNDPANQFVPEQYTRAETSGWEITVDKARSDADFVIEKK